MAARRVPFEVFLQTLKSKKADLAMAGFGLLCLALTTAKMSLNKELKQLDEEYEGRLAVLQAENDGLRRKISAVKDRVLSEASATRNEELLRNKMKLIFDDQVQQQVIAKPEQQPQQEQKPKSRFFV